MKNLPTLKFSTGAMLPRTLIFKPYLDCNSKLFEFVSGQNRYRPVRYLSRFSAQIGGAPVLHRPQPCQEHDKSMKLLNRQARHLLREVGRDKPLEGLRMIDAIQRLGIDYYFEKEIKEILDMIVFRTTIDHNHGLADASLCFRLLRQQGHHIPAGRVFNKFKDNEGKFSSKLIGNDIKGMMGLYEASQLCTDGEEDRVLEEGGELSRRILDAWLTNHHDDEDEDQARAVGHTLEHPYHMSLARLRAKEFHMGFHGNYEWTRIIKEVAVLDCSMVKSIHQKEIHQVTKWWEGLGLGKELEFARSQPMKWHMWSMAILTDPSLSSQRVELTKPISLVYVIDDIFDVYGTIDQLALLTNVVDRWDYEAIEELPEFMKICVKALFDTTYEISAKIYRQHGWNPFESLQNAWKRLCNAFLVEAKWFRSGDQCPKADEYLKNGIVSSGVHVISLHIFFLLGHDITTENVEFVENIPNIVSSVGTILRLWDDLGSAKDENQEGRDGSYIDYYVKENSGCSVESARGHVVDMISDSWKSLNHACLSGMNPFSASFTKACLNSARMVPLMYGYDEKHNLANLNEYI